MNSLIVKKIKAARLERGKTQKDIADYLGKTAASISDLERGKVQVTASELYSLAQFLNKPIEYFFGIASGEPEIQDLVAMMRKHPTGLSSTIQLTKMMLKMQELMDEAITYPQDQKVPAEMLIRFYNLILPFSKALNAKTAQVNDLRDQFDKEIKIQGIDISKTSSLD